MCFRGFRRGSFRGWDGGEGEFRLISGRLRLADGPGTALAVHSGVIRLSQVSAITLKSLGLLRSSKLWMSESTLR